MFQDSLVIIHQSKKKESDPVLWQRLRSRLDACFEIDTCQRSLWVTTTQCMPLLVERDFEIYRGQEAYCFFLRVAAGLESEILGETDIFGQLKAAWRLFEQQSRGAQKLSVRLLYFDLAPWMQALFEDTKKIRSQFLQNVGGHSYASLVRKWIKQNLMNPDPIFILGAGQMAQSIAPFLSEYRLLLWNRSPERLLQLERQFKDRSLVDRLEDERQGWARAKTAIVCTPVDDERDAPKVAWLKQLRELKVIHLGASKKQPSSWTSWSHCFCLDDLFEFKRCIQQSRRLHIQQAEHACQEQAKQRYLHENDQIRNAQVSFSMGTKFVGC